MTLVLKSEEILKQYHEKEYLRYSKDALRDVCAPFDPLSWIEKFNTSNTKLRKIDALNVYDTYAADVAELLSKQWKMHGFFIWDAWAMEKHQSKNIRYLPSFWLFILLYAMYIVLLMLAPAITWWQCTLIAIVALPAWLLGFIFVFGIVHGLTVYIQWQYITYQINRRTKAFEQTEVYSIWVAQQAEKRNAPRYSIQDVKREAKQEQPTQGQYDGGLMTIHRVGPTLLTYRYPVNTDALQEIIREDGLIGPHKYQDDGDTIEHIKDCDNDWFLFDHPDQQAMLEQDLMTLVKKHKLYGAYSFMGAITPKVAKQQKYWKLGAEYGVVECMVSYACTLYTSGYLADGFYWLKKGADAGDRIGCLLTAVSYQYGTLSEINLEKAAMYYQKSIQTEPNYFAYLNLGAMLMDVGYIRTALSYFQKAKEYVQDYIHYSHEEPEKCDKNIKVCQQLLQYPYDQRMKMFTQETSSRKLDTIFCDNRQGYTKISNLFDTPITKWDPQSIGIEVDPLDIQDIETAPIQPTTRPTDKDEDYKFQTYKVTIDTPTIMGFPGELIFLEKNCHAALNAYIREHLLSLRATFKQSGYTFTYLPSHHYDLEDRMDIIGSYNRAHKTAEAYFTMGYDHPDASEYWYYLESERPLPKDCAGILRNVPTGKGKNKDKHYEYILFPYRPGTDWARVFAMLADKLRHDELPMPPHSNEAIHFGKLPEGAYLNIDKDFEITLRSKDDEQLTKIHLTPMPKVMLLALLNHPEGIVIKNMIDIREELLGYYRAITKGKGDEKNIDMLCDPTSNSANEKISRIRQAFTKSLTTFYLDDLPLFLPEGKRGGAYVIRWNRNRINR